MKHFFIPTKHNNHTPHLLSRSAFLIYIVVMIVFNMVLGRAGLLTLSADITIQDLLSEHNAEREKRGLTPLRLNNTLSISANEKGKAMIAEDCWSHYCPDGKSPWDFFLAAGYDYEHAGENLAEGFDDPMVLIDAWMNSPTHRDNILNPNFNEVGFAIVSGDYQGKKNNTLIVVHFGRELAGNFAEGTVDVTETTAGFLTIDNLVEGQILNQQFLEVSGKVQPMDFMVDVFFNNEAVGRVKAEGENYAYRSDRNLTDGSYNIYSQIVSDVVNIRSNVINVRVDGSMPFIDEDSVHSYQLNSEEVVIEFNTSKDVIMVSTNVPILSIEQNEPYKWKLTFSIDVINSINSIQITLKDFSENTTTFNLSISEVLKELERLFSENNSQNASKSVPEQFISRLIDDSITKAVPILFTTFLIALFVVDFIVLYRTNMLGSVKRKSHSHLSIFVVLLMVMLIGGMGGSILNGSYI